MVNKNIHQLIIGSGYSLFALVAVKGVDVVSSMIVARLLGPRNLGMFAIIKYLLELLCLFTALGIPTAMVKFLAESDAGAQAISNKLQITSSKSQVVSTSLVSMLIPTFLTCGIVFWISDLIAQNIYHELSLGLLIRISVGTLFAMTLLMFGTSVLQGLQEIKKISIARILNSVLGLPVVIFLVYYSGLKGAVISRAMVALIGIIVIGWIFIHGSRFTIDGSLFTIDRSFLKRLLNLAFPTFISGLVMVPALWIMTTRLSITKGFAQVGFFNVAYALMQIILFIPIAVGIPFVPKISQLNTGEPEAISSIMFTSIYSVGIITLSISMVFAIFSKNILLLLYGAEYLDAWSILIPLATASFLASLGYIIGYYLIGIGKMWIGVAFNLIWFVILIGSSIPLISLYSAKGLGIAYLGSYTIATLIMLLFIKKTLNLKLTPLIWLVISGLVFTSISYLIVNYLHGSKFLLSSGLFLITFLMFQYYTCPVKGRLLATFKSVLGSHQ